MDDRDDVEQIGKQVGGLAIRRFEDRCEREKELSRMRDKLKEKLISRQANVLC